MNADKTESSRKTSSECEPRNYHSFRKARNYQTEQQAVFIALLNLGYDIEIIRPQRRSHMTHSFLKINALINNRTGDAIDFHTLLQNRIKSMYDNDISNGVTAKTAARRMECNKISEELHLLTEILKKDGVMLNVTSSMISGNYRQTVIAIDFEGVHLSKGDVSNVGGKINEAIVDRLYRNKGYKQMWIRSKDLEFMSLLMSD